VELLKLGSGRRVAGRAERLPFANESFDVVTAGQCWHWFDRLIAPKEIARVLKPAGRVAIVYQTYLPMPGNIAAASEEVILRYRPRWRHAGGVGINGQALKDLQNAQFRRIESFSFDVEIPFTRRQWQGFVRTCSAVGPSLSNEELGRFDADHAKALLDWPELLNVPHRVFVAVATRP
jgi:SAM-dependent methyltransferase